MELLLPAFVTFLVVIDPVGVAAIFMGLTSDLGSGERRRLAARGVAIAALVLGVFAYGGAPMLEALGIGLPAFRIAGGILLLLLSIDMVMARQSGLRTATPGEYEESGRREDISVFPLAIPLIAGPGTLTSVLLLMGQARGDAQAQLAIVAVIVGVLLLTFLCLLTASTLMRYLGVTGINVVSRVLGIVVAALAVQFIIDGVVKVLASIQGGNI